MGVSVSVSARAVNSICSVPLRIHSILFYCRIVQQLFGNNHSIYFTAYGLLPLLHLVHSIPSIEPEEAEGNFRMPPALSGYSFTFLSCCQRRQVSVLFSRVKEMPLPSIEL